MLIVIYLIEICQKREAIWMLNTAIKTISTSKTFSLSLRRGKLGNVWLMSARKPGQGKNLKNGGRLQVINDRFEQIFTQPWQRRSLIEASLGVLFRALATAQDHPLRWPGRTMREDYLLL